MNCKLVCRRFKFYCEKVKINELIIGWNDFYKRFDWFYTEDAINRNNQIQKLSILSSPLFNLKYLKRLKIGKRLNGEQFKFLNQFTNLEQLEINNFVGECKDPKLNLANLRILFIYRIDASLSLELPRLEAVFCRSLDQTKFIFKESIKYLEVDFCYGDFKNFINLETFVCNNDVDIIEKDFLECMPKLKEIHFPEENLEPEDYNRSKRGIIEIIEIKQRLKMNDLKIYFQNSLLEHDEEDIIDDEK